MWCTTATLTVTIFWPHLQFSHDIFGSPKKKFNKTCVGGSHEVRGIWVYG